jgi:predicted  nucleic acid-binding Zn-ribbon protein
MPDNATCAACGTRYRIADDWAICPHCGCNHYYPIKPEEDND